MSNFLKKNTTFIICSLLLVAQIIGSVKTNYRYNNTVYNHWVLADRSSTIQEKSRHIDDFVKALDGCGFKGRYDAFFLKEPTVSFDRNLDALKSLQQRLRDIETMDPNSFQYNTAIQQIAAQEQGEAHEMLGVFWGIYFLEHFIWGWDWIGVLTFFVLLIGIIRGIVHP